MPFDLGPLTAGYLGLALFIAAYVRGYSGFGFSAIFIAFAALVTNPLPLIPVVFACEMAMTAVQARGVRGHIAWKTVVPLVIGAALVIPFSVSFILTLGEATVRAVISGMILILSLLLLSGWGLKRQAGAIGHTAVGVMSGLCNSAGIGGLPVAAFLTAQPVQAAVFRATMIVYLAALDLITLPFLWAGGLVTADTGTAIIYALPPLGFGVWLGSRRFRGTNPQTFRRFAVFLLLFLSLMGLLKTIVM